MTQRPQFNHTGPESARKPEFCECDHGDDLIFTFGMPLANHKQTFDVKYTEDEKKLSMEWMKYIVNFATTGYVIFVLFSLMIIQTKADLLHNSKNYFYKQCFPHCKATVKFNQVRI